MDALFLKDQMPSHFRKRLQKSSKSACKKVANFWDTNKHNNNAQILGSSDPTQIAQKCSNRCGTAVFDEL